MLTMFDKVVALIGCFTIILVIVATITWLLWSYKII